MSRPGRGSSPAQVRQKLEAKLDFGSGEGWEGFELDTT